MVTLGIDLGGTKILVAAVERGAVLDSTQVPTPQTGFADVIGAITAAARQVLASPAGKSISRAGIGSPGPLDLKNGRVLWAPNIVGMEDAPLTATLQEALGLPVTLENDANAAGYAEHLYGAARGLETSVYLTLSTGIGGGLFVGDTIIHGANGIAGEVGHMAVLPGGPVGGDGHPGTLEAIAAGRAIARDASYAYGFALETKEVFARAERGERTALAIIDNAAEFTAVGMANLVKLFDPAAFVLGGGLTRAGDFYLDRIRERLERHLEGYPRPEVRLALLGDDAGVIGAAATAARSGRNA